MNADRSNRFCNRSNIGFQLNKTLGSHHTVNIELSLELKIDSVRWVSNEEIAIFNVIEISRIDIPSELSIKLCFEGGRSENPIKEVD